MARRGSSSSLRDVKRLGKVCRQTMRFTNDPVRAYRQPPAALVGIMANEQLRHLLFRIGHVRCVSAGPSISVVLAPLVQPILFKTVVYTDLSRRPISVVSVLPGSDFLRTSRLTDPDPVNRVRYSEPVHRAGCPMV